MSTTTTTTTSPPIPPTMRAWTYHRRGPVHDVLTLTPNHPTPTLAPSSPDVLIRVTHAALTPSIGRFIPLLPFLRGARPCIPEVSFTGTVAQTTPHTPPHLAPNTRVFGLLPLSAQLLRGEGALAQYVRVAPADVAPCPAEVLPEDAAGLDGNGQAALKMCRAAGVGPRSRVFVNGGTGGVGTMVVQVAKALGAAEVVATGSGEEGSRLVKSLGADVVVDYRECGKRGVVGWLAERYGGDGDRGKLDAVLDCVGTQILYERSPEFLKEEGVFVNVGAMEGMGKWLWATTVNLWWPVFLGGTPRKFVFQQTNIDQEGREELLRLVKEGKLKRVLDSVFEMEDVLGVSILFLPLFLLERALTDAETGL